MVAQENRSALVRRIGPVFYCTLIDQAGRVYWRTTGVFEDAKARELAQVLVQHIPPVFETIWMRN